MSETKDLIFRMRFFEHTWALDVTKPHCRPLDSEKANNLLKLFIKSVEELGGSKLFYGLTNLLYGEVVQETLAHTCSYVTCAKCFVCKSKKGGYYIYIGEHESLIDKQGRVTGCLDDYRGRPSFGLNMALFGDINGLWVSGTHVHCDDDIQLKEHIKSKIIKESNLCEKRIKFLDRLRSNGFSLPTECSFEGNKIKAIWAREVADNCVTSMGAGATAHYESKGGENTEDKLVCLPFVKTKDVYHKDFDLTLRFTTLEFEDYEKLFDLCVLFRE